MLMKEERHFSEDRGKTGSMSLNCMTMSLCHWRAELLSSQRRLRKAPSQADGLYAPDSHQTVRTKQVWSWRQDFGLGAGKAVVGLFTSNESFLLPFQLFFPRECGLYGYLLPPVPSRHGFLLPGDLVV